MFPSLAALWLAATATAAADTSAPATPAPPDSSRRHIVRQFEPIVVEGGRRSDPASLETVYTIPSTALRALPVDRFTDASRCRRASWRWARTCTCAAGARAS